MGIFAYFVYAFIQAILVARYIMKEKENPVLLVFLMALFAPLVTIIVGFSFLSDLIKWAVTGQRPKIGDD